MDRGEEQDQQDEQDSTEGELSAANESDADSQGTESASVAKEGEVMTAEQVQKLLQSIRDRDMLRRMRQRAIQESRRVRVEKDW